MALCRRDRSGPGLSFTTGDAQDLPFPDDAFDVVVNVESSHCYDVVPAFLSEVARVLRPGGLLCWAAFRPAGDVETTRTQFRAAHPALARFAALAGSQSHRAFAGRETVHLSSRLSAP